MSSESEIRHAEEQIFDALDAAADDVGWYDRDIGTVDMQVREIALALLRAGWKPPLLPGQRKLECDSVSLHRVPRGVIAEGLGLGTLDAHGLGEQIGVGVPINDSKHVTLLVPRSEPEAVWGAPVLWLGDKVVWVLRSDLWPAGSIVSVGPFPIIVTMS